MYGAIDRAQTDSTPLKLLGVRRFLTNEKDGVAAIEFAIILPIFLLLLFGLVNFGYLLFAKHSMQRVAGETMRAVAYGELSASAAQDFAKAEMEAALGDFSAGQLRPTVRMLPGGSEFVVSISIDAEKFDLVKFPPIEVSRFMPRVEVRNTGKMITRFNPSI